METLKFLKKMMEDEMRTSKEFNLGSDEEFIKELNEAIEEIETLESRSCDNCEHWHRVNDFNVSNPCYQWAKDVMTKKHFCCNLWEAKQ